MNNKDLFEKYQTGNHWNDYPDEYARNFLLLLPANFPTDFLLVDAGCGNGKNTDFFRRAGVNVLGIDNNPEEITLANKKFPQSCFFLMNIEELSFTDSYVDAFFMTNVIHYVDENKVFSEIRRTLKLGGFFYIHFNLLIRDDRDRVDYRDDERRIIESVSQFFEIKYFSHRRRVDLKPVWHEHFFLEILLQKK